MSAEPKKTLEIGLSYQLPTYSGSKGPVADMPRGAAFTIDRKAAEEIVKLAKVVKDNQLNSVEKFDYRVTWLKQDPTSVNSVFEPIEESDARMICACLHVDCTAFWFSSLEMYSNTPVETEMCDIEDLIRHFELGGAA